MKERLSCYRAAAELCAAFMKGPRTWHDACDMAGVFFGSDSCYRWLEEFRASGLLRVCGWHRNSRGKPSAIFELQQPFAQPDVEAPRAARVE